jgi:uncharacterized protein YbjT (DUF2867 family)
MTNILVLGGTGFVGAHVCEKLVRQGFAVTVPTRKRKRAEKVQHLPGLTVLELDVHDEAALTRTVAGHDAVVNLVAILHGKQAAFQHVHVELPRKLARACAANHVQQVVHISALGADAAQAQSAPSMYLRSKSQGEAVWQQAATVHGLDVTLLRPSVIFGAEDKFLNLFAKLQKVFPVIPLAGAHARFAPVWVEDVATAVVRSLQVQGAATAPKVLELCGPEVFTLKELVQLAGRLSGVNEGRGRPIVPLPHWAGYLQALMMEWAPGAPLMSRDNLDSMKVDNIATGKVPGLASLDITPAALQPIAEDYLSQSQPTYGLLGVRVRSRYG